LRVVSVRDCLRGKRGGLAAFLLIAALLAGGLGWATRAALQLESEQRSLRAAAERGDRLRLALWRLDSRMTAFLAGEDARPFSHYSAVFAPPVALDSNGQPVPPGAVVELSPLLSTELPDWMLLHFQSDEAGWESPQVHSDTLQARLRTQARGLVNVTARRRALLEELRREVSPATLLARVRKYAGQPRIRDRAVMARLEQLATGNQTSMLDIQEAGRNEFNYRLGQQSKLVNPPVQEARVSKDVALLNSCRNGEEWLSVAPLPPNGKPPQSQTFLGTAQHAPLARVPTSAEVTVTMSRVVGLWLSGPTGQDRLLAVRLVRVEEKDICQGILLDAGLLMGLLKEEVQDLFPESDLLPAREPTPDQLDRTMTTLPLRLDPGPEPIEEPAGWTPLRVGLSLAWLAALVGLGAVGAGGWSLLTLSQRRIRFVSAVTHELRTPLTTLRLYLDMLLGGLVPDDRQREYLETMNAETDRLTRLVGNVLDFSRLENQAPKLVRVRVNVADLLARASETWQGRCAAAGKQLEVEDATPPGGAVETDADLLLQVLANLLDNSCKYSREAEERRLWLRARAEGGRVVFEVEDRGPGVPAPERRSIFRPFRRGKCADATTGGVGLGLALARWWTQLLGGRLELRCPAEGGACFRVVLAVAQHGHE
jgi:signal transduction histidine kinase